MRTAVAGRPQTSRRRGSCCFDGGGWHAAEGVLRKVVKEEITPRGLRMRKGRCCSRVCQASEVQNSIKTNVRIQKAEFASTRRVPRQPTDKPRARLHVQLELSRDNCQTTLLVHVLRLVSYSYGPSPSQSLRSSKYPGVAWI
eukprot:1770798-Amphidinium_carterae.1